MDDNFENPTFEPDTDEPDIDDGAPFVGATLSSTVELPAVGQATATPLSQELLQDAVNNYYEALALEGLTPALGRDPAIFEISTKGRLQLKNFPGVDIINARTGRPLSLATIAGKRGGSKIVRELGFDWTRPKKRLPARTVEALQAKGKELGEVATRLESGGGWS